MTKIQFSAIYAIGFYAGYVAKDWRMVFVGIGVFIAWELIVSKVLKIYKINTSIEHK